MYSERAFILYFAPPMNPVFNFLEITMKRSLQKIGLSIFGWRKYFALERRRQLRYPVTVQVGIYVSDEISKKPLTSKIAGRLVNISRKGACLQTNTIRIGYHHLVISNDLEGQTPLILEFPPSPEGIPWTLKSQILWYNTVNLKDKFKFEYGIAFVDLSPTQQERLESLMKSI